MTAAGLGIIYLFPLIPVIGKSLPSPLVCIVTLTAFAVYMGVDIRTVGDMGQLPDTLPIFLWPEVPLTFETLMIIFPYSAGLAVVGLTSEGSVVVGLVAAGLAVVRFMQRRVHHSDAFDT